MIRLAFVAVVALAGLLAVGGFFLVRGGESTPTGIEVEQAQVATPPAAAVEPERLYFLRDIDLTQGPITIVLRDPITGQGDLVVRDGAALLAAQDSAYVNTSTNGGAVVGMVVLAMMGLNPKETVVQIYRDDTLINSVGCQSMACGSLAAERDVNLGALLEVAQPLVAAQAYHDTYEDYLASIDTITWSPDYMFLDLRPSGEFPLQRQTARMELAMPTLILPAGTYVNPNDISDRIRAELPPLLAEGARIDGVRLSNRGAGVVVDRDRGSAVLVGGQPIPFPEVDFHTITVPIDGASTLDARVLDQLATPLLARTDYADAFAEFVTTRLQNSCSDCFDVKMNGDFHDVATIISSNPEGYRLDYYDLRDAP